MATTLLLAILGVAVILYVILGGADFGVGILETVASASDTKLIQTRGSKAMAPIWETNHIWMILALVVLFVGFPALHFEIVVALHIPVVALLLGIVLRGTAFVFRYYDFDDAPKTRHAAWTFAFRLGSFVGPFFLGVVCASLSRGRFSTAGDDFYAAYIAPWLGWFPIATGLFVCALYAWLAAVFLTTETKEQERASMSRLAKGCSLSVILFGALTSLAAWLEHNPALVDASDHALRGLVFVIAGISFASVWVLLKSRAVWRLRVLAGVMMSCIFGGYFFAMYPSIVYYDDKTTLTWHDSVAPVQTQWALLCALGAGMILIGPGIIWLFAVFKSKSHEA